MTLLEPCQDRQPLLLPEQGQGSSPRLHKSKCKEGEIFFEQKTAVSNYERRKGVRERPLPD